MFQIFTDAYFQVIFLKELNFELSRFFYSLTYAYTIYFGIKMVVKTLFKVEYKYKDYSKNDNIHLIYYD